MAEKRFTYDKPLVAFSKGGINDNVTGEIYEFTMDTVLDLLNELHEENKQLKEAVWSWSKSYTRVYEKNELLKQRIDYLIRKLKTEMATSISRNERIRLNFAIRVLERLKGDVE